MVTQKSKLYIKLFSTLSRVRLMSCVLSQLNILCTSLVKSHYTENDNSPVIHHSHVTAILVFSDVLDFVEAVCSIYQNIQYFIRSKNCVLNFTADRYSLHKCRETMLC